MALGDVAGSLDGVLAVFVAGKGCLQLRGIIHIHVDQIEAQVMLSEIVEPAVNLDFQRAVIVGGALFDACALGILCCKCSCARTKEQKDQDKQHFFCKFFHVSSFR